MSGWTRGRKRAELEALGVHAGWDLTDEALDAMLAAEKQRRAEMYEQFIRAGRVTPFPALGVQVAGDGKAYTIGDRDPVAKADGSRLVGTLAGAQAMVTSGAPVWSPGRAAFLPVALAGLATTTQADAAVVFADGTVWTRALNNPTQIRRAQLEAVRFNVLARHWAPGAAPGSAPRRSG